MRDNLTIRGHHVDTMRNADGVVFGRAVAYSRERGVHCVTYAIHINNRNQIQWESRQWATPPVPGLGR